MVVVNTFMVLRDVTLHSIVNKFQHFGETYYLHLHCSYLPNYVESHPKNYHNLNQTLTLMLI
jgi:hypothetical protein